MIKNNPVQFNISVNSFGKWKKMTNATLNSVLSLSFLAGFQVATIQVPIKPISSCLGSPIVFYIIRSQDI